MKFVIISDTHGFHRDLNLPAGDILIHCGDFTEYGKEEEVFDFLNWYEQLDFKHKIFIAGNHDFFVSHSPQQFNEMIPNKINYLNENGVSIDGINIWGSPIRPDAARWIYGRKRGEEIKAHWELIPKNTNILVTHTPARGILDTTNTGRLRGCDQLKEQLELIQPEFHVFGHVHSSYGTLKQGKTTYINAACADPEKGVVKQAISFEFNKPKNL